MLYIVLYKVNNHALTAFTLVAKSNKYVIIESLFIRTTDILEYWRFMTTGIVALSFAKRAIEPNPVNVRLANITDEVDDELQSIGEQTIVVAQWEIARALPTPPHLIVGQDAATNTDRNGKPYLDSKDVLEAAFELFRAAGVKRVVVVANPFLHMHAVKSMVRKADFKVDSFSTPWVGFDSDQLNVQWWCKGPVRFMSYLALQVFGKLIGKNFHGIWEKPHPH